MSRPAGSERGPAADRHDAYGEAEQLGAFACILDELLAHPVPATVMGEPVELLAVEEGGVHLGLRATCRRAGTRWTIALVDVAVEPASGAELALTLAAYRHWVGEGLS